MWTRAETKAMVCSLGTLFCFKGGLGGSWPEQHGISTKLILYDRHRDTTQSHLCAGMPLFITPATREPLAGSKFKLCVPCIRGNIC